METGSAGRTVRQDLPATGAELFVPSLLAGLDADDAETVESAGFALCLVALEEPNTVPDIVEGLVDRLLDDPVDGPVLWTLASIADEHGSRIRDTLRDRAARDDARALNGHIRQSEGWNLPAELSADSGTARSEFVRTFRELVDSDGHSREVTEEDASDGESSTEGEITHPEVEPDEGDDRTGPETTGGPRRPAAVRKRQQRIDEVAESRAFQRIVSLSRFDGVDVTAPETERRYGHAVRARAVEDGTEQGIAIRLCHRPEEASFGDTFRERVTQWADVDADRIVAVKDWGTEPRPWIATEYVEERLTGRERLSPTETLTHAVVLTAALTTLHRHDLVHGGIDPHSVVYAADVFDETKHPMLDNPGMLPLYRQYVNPASYLDPRYAAPEYFDSTYGSLDHATDIYQLGMTLYRICTGEPPFDGSFEEIKTGVLKDQPPAPSSANGVLPETLDEIVAKATAKQKLTRYETTLQFHEDVRRLCERVTE